MESRCEVYRETRAFQVSIDTSRVHDEIDALKKKFKNGDWNVVSAELAYMQIDVSDMHYTLSALNALATVEANTNIERYLAILGPEKVKTLTNALKKGYELESAGQHNMELLSAYRRNIRLLNCWLEAHLIS